MRARPPQSATSRHYAEPIQANSGDYDELDGDYDLAGRDSNDVDEGYVHRVRPRRTSDMSISVQGPAAPQRTPAPPYVVSRDKPRRAASPLAEFAADPLAAMRYDEDVDLDAEYDAVDDFNDDDGYHRSTERHRRARDTLVDLHTGRNTLRASRRATGRAPGPRGPRRATARAPETTSRASRPATTRRFLRP
jgi:hypothetical protein